MFFELKVMKLATNEAMEWNWLLQRLLLLDEVYN